MKDMLSFRRIGDIYTLVVFCLFQYQAFGRVNNKKLHYTPEHHALHIVIRKTQSHLKDFEIAVPEVVDVLGNHVTHDLLHHRRLRRSVHSNITSEIPVFYKISAHNKDFHIGVVPNKIFLDPKFYVKKIQRDQKTGKLIEKIETNTELDCHFSGHMVSHENSGVAISLCNGMSGLLRTEEDDFLIEPIPPEIHHNFSQPQHPHIIYKRRHLKNSDTHYCGNKKWHPTPVLNQYDNDIGYMSDGSFFIRPEENSVLSKDETSNDASFKTKDDNNIQDRSKRDISVVTKRRRKIVETLVVADRELIEKHKSDHVDVATYILTVMNLVSALFRDGTLDTDIEIVLIGLTLLDDDKEIELGHKAGKSLENFCRWQTKTNSTIGRTPDHSILLTGINICVDKDEPCDTLGLAEIGGMCSSSGSCTINEDTGLGLAFTVAHETGHSLGMRHDGQGNTCSKSGGQIMSPIINTLNGVFTWSSCSRKAMEEFLKTNQSQCLNNVPDKTPELHFSLPRELPGQLYSADDQCNLQFGKNRKLCDSRYISDKDHLCKALWCQRSDGSCETKYVPASEGTVCGENYWCRRGKCVPYGSSGPLVVNGGWSEYGEWSKCSRSCGIGVATKYRQCNNPSPMYGGRHCEGEDRIYKLCNTWNCPPSVADYRSQQCAEFNSKQYRHQYFNWIPYTKYWKHGSNKCELICEAEGFGFFDRLAAQVKDGTSCDNDSNDVCVAGKCEHVGCDRVLLSEAVTDVCGVCNGKNKTCRLYNGSHVGQVHDSGYYFVARLPIGASTIRIRQNTCCTHSYIAVRDAHNASRYYLNGNWEIDMQKETRFAGVKWHYKRKFSQPQELITDGTITQSIVIEGLFNMGKNTGISYSYYINEIENALPYEVLTKDTKTNITYSWQMEISSCSKSCAGGIKQSVARCMKNDITVADDLYCKHLARPITESKSCNMNPCPATWVKRRWHSCNASCGIGMRARDVVCAQNTTRGQEIISDLMCDVPRPQKSKTCFLKECSSQWKTGRWTKCSKTCGKGQRTRNVYCADESGYKDNDKCELEKKPKSKRGCRLAKCRRQYQWLITAWGKCSTTCGLGWQRRKVQCSRKSRRGGYKPAKRKRCKHKPKPKISTKRTCTSTLCTKTSSIENLNTSSSNNDSPSITLKSNSNNTREYSPHTRPKWIANDWEKCSVTCGGGTQFRRVTCWTSLLSPADCPAGNKPTAARTCNTYDCPVDIIQDEFCSDKFTWCYLVPHHRTCGHKYFGSQCCKSCKSNEQRKST
uniref:A disintegrin and metalloproteinase with thrombospondin motifs 18-like isoform X1 n=1 Tax=Styela clava TaxID=7725 RepID=UPI001939A40C|nr:A disintegrin and metalloproteinase with thrombospondin motifs 18-like isoform X1 [Styela clava]